MCCYDINTNILKYNHDIILITKHEVDKTSACNINYEINKNLSKLNHKLYEGKLKMHAI